MQDHFEEPLLLNSSEPDQTAAAGQALFGANAGLATLAARVLVPMVLITGLVVTVWPDAGGDRISAEGPEPTNSTAPSTTSSTTMATTAQGPPETNAPLAVLAPDGPEITAVVEGFEDGAKDLASVEDSANAPAAESIDDTPSADDGLAGLINPDDPLSLVTTTTAAAPAADATTEPTSKPVAAAGRKPATTASPEASAETTSTQAPVTVDPRPAPTAPSAQTTTTGAPRATTTTTAPATTEAPSTTEAPGTTARATTTIAVAPATTEATTTTVAPTTTTTEATITTTTVAPTTTTTEATTTTTTTEPPPPTTATPPDPGTCPSGQFSRVMRDDFNGSSLAGHWSPYNSGGNAGYGLRRPSAITVQDGKLVITGQMEGGQLVSGGLEHRYNQQYGRYRFRVRTDNDPSQALSGVVLTWPQSDQHPRDGENNIYETLVQRPERNPFFTFIHKPFGSHSDQEYKEHHADGSQWQIMSMEWTENRITITREGPGRDGNYESWTVDESTADLIPDNPHKLAIQLDAWKHSMSGSVRMELDWVEVYKYCR